MKKATRILTTILVLSIITILYSFVVAPAIEPVSKYQNGDQSKKPDGPKSPFLAIFNPNDWEINCNTQLNYNNFHIFIGDYKLVTPEQIKINKFTVVAVNPNNSSQVIILRCMGEISLEFEKPLSHSLEDNRLLNGSITDEIHIFSKGYDDVFSLKTRDFSIDKGLIRTKANVAFKYGKSQGFGSGLRIQLISHKLFGSTPENISDSVPISLKIEKIMLEKLQRLTIVPPAKKENGKQNDSRDAFSAPIELHCDGQFVFNVLRKNASFEQNVSLIQMVSNREPNAIRCQYLNLYFTPANSGDSDKQTDGQKNDSETSLDEWNLQLARLEASGPLVVIEAPEYQTKIHTNRLIANLSPLSFELDSTNRQSEIHYKSNTISAQNLIYYVGENGSLGTLDCNCPGWISSQMEQDGKQIRVRWSDRLRLEPDQNDVSESIVSIQGGARLEMESNNNTEAAITADDIFFWLTRTADTSQSNGFEKMTLSRMQAKNNVVMKSKPITAKVKTLQLWFEQLGGEAGEGKRQEIAGSSLDSPTVYSLMPNASNSELNHSYSVTGALLQGKILIGQDQFQIGELTLKDDVRIVQNGDDNSKLELSGSQIQAFNITLPSATASLIGQPAKIRYNNAMLTGTAINVNRGTSRIWIDSGGEAVFLGGEKSEANSKNQAAASQYMSPAKISWSKNMVFQNDTLTFTGDVSLERKDQYAQCDALSIVLNKKIDFQNLSSEEQKTLDVRYVALNNSVKLENVTVENGVTAAMDCLTASKMTIDMKKQTFVAEGPGRAMTQRKMKGNDDDAEAKQSETEGKELEANASSTHIPLSQLAARNSQLINLSVDFQKRLEGSIAPQSLSTFTFTGYVQAVYSPIDEIGKPIKTFTISELPPQAFTLKCNQMEIQADLKNAELDISKNSLASNSGASSGAFIASGGVTLEGLNYNAVADRITFEEKRGVMTLEGSDSKPAQLFYQKVLGGRYNQASSSAIYYNTQTGAVKGEGIQEFSLFLAPKQ